MLFFFVEIAVETCKYVCMCVSMHICSNVSLCVCVCVVQGQVHETHVLKRHLRRQVRARRRESEVGLCWL
jgi:hypothetical protein